MGKDKEREQRLGARLRDARLKRKLLQEDLAASSGVSQQAISILERRNSRATTFLFDLADALEVNPRWLLTGNGDSWVDSLQGQLNEIYYQLNQEERDALLYRANQLLSEQKKAPGPHDPYQKARKAKKVA